MQARRWQRLLGSVYFPWVMHSPAVSPADRTPCGLFKLCRLCCASSLLWTSASSTLCQVWLLHSCPSVGTMVQICPRAVTDTWAAPGLWQWDGHAGNLQGKNQSSGAPKHQVMSSSGAVWHSLGHLSPFELVQEAAIWPYCSYCMVKIKSPLQIECIIFHWSEILPDCNSIL